MGDSAVKSANVRKKEELQKDIMDLLKKSNIPLSTSDLAYKLSKSWHTIDRACLMLQIVDKVEGFKAGKMNLWRDK
jgi:hypothetical protein